jgi:hypothetical protein
MRSVVDCFGSFSCFRRYICESWPLPVSMSSKNNLSRSYKGVAFVRMFLQHDRVQQHTINEALDVFSEYFCLIDMMHILKHWSWLAYAPDLNQDYFSSSVVFLSIALQIRFIPYTIQKMGKKFCHLWSLWPEQCKISKDESWRRPCFFFSFFFLTFTIPWPLCSETPDTKMFHVFSK